MHYLGMRLMDLYVDARAHVFQLGQVAIDFFQMRNKIAFVIGASIIAVCAVTAALLIFFKLREQWENQWYKRLGCAMLMGVAVCGTSAKSTINVYIIG